MIIKNVKRGMIGMIGKIMSNWKNGLLQIECKYDFNTRRTNEIVSTQFYIKEDLLEKKRIAIMILENEKLV